MILKDDGTWETPVEIALKHVQLPFELRKYQVEDLNRLAPLKYHAGFLGVGMGKTLLSILISVYKLLEESYDGVYILCPASLVVQWRETLLELNLSCAIYRGTPSERRKVNRDVDFLIMSFQIFQNDYDILRKKNTFLIVDECQILGNLDNVTYKMLQGGELTSVKKVPGKLMPEITKRTFAGMNEGCCLLSATPLANVLQSYPLIKILTPGVYTNMAQFMRIHVVEFDQFNRPKEYANLDLLKENLMRNASLRNSADHLDLPPVTYKTIQYELDPGHMKLYKKLLEEKYLELKDGEVIDALQVNALYHWSQKLIFSPCEAGYKKEPVGVEIMDTMTQAANNYVAFSNYKLTNAFLMNRYKENAGACYGDIPRKQQEEYIEKFKAGSLKGLICNPRSAGFGLNLQNCQTVLFPELPLTARDFFQCVGRAARQGQELPVTVVVMVAKGTIQESLFRKLKLNDALIAKIIDAPDLLDDVFAQGQKIEGKKNVQDVFKELRGEE